MGDQKFAIWCIILILFTTSIGQPIVLYVAALGNVDASMVEAAQVDGANHFQTFWKIKWPSIMPTTLYIIVITTINSFQCYALIQLLTSGGPNHSTDTIMYYIYYQAFKLYRYGYGNAMGVFLAIIIAVFSALQFSMVEAAQVDGANHFQTFWKIKWPSIMPTTLYIIVITTINSFQCYALIQLLTSGGPNHSTDTIMYYIYYEAFKLYRYGYGNAMGVFLAIIIAVFSALQFKLTKAGSTD